MKKVLIVVFTLLSLNAFSAPKDFGAGIMLGNPTGLNGKYWLSEEQAIDGGIGLSPGRGNNVSLHSDYLWHKKEAFYFNDTQPLDLFYGLGGRMEFDHDIEVGVRIPVGLAYIVKEQGADMFAEVAPVIDFITRKGLELNLAFGARFYFR